MSCQGTAPHPETLKISRIVREIHEGVNLVRSREPRLPAAYHYHYWPAAYFVGMEHTGRYTHRVLLNQDVRVDRGDADVLMAQQLQ